MDEKLYYEKKNVTTAAEVKEIYDYAAVNNIKYYRAATEKGVFFGWVDGKHAKAADGQQWFENPEYKEPKIEITPDISINECGLENEHKPVETAEKTVEITTEEVAKENTTDYKSLYEQSQEILIKTQDELANWVKRYNTIKAELDNIKNAFVTVAKELKEAIDKTE